MIDLRSDTVSRPTEEMRRAMASAPVGDDVFGEDPTIQALERVMTGLFRKEAALFVTSGVMANQLAINAHTRPGDEVIVEAESHVFHYETGGPSIISGVQLHCVAGVNGVMDPTSIAAAIRSEEYYFPRTSLVVIENTHNRAGGTIQPIENIRAISRLCGERGLRLHMDGARLWNAHVATGIPLHEYAALVDSVSVCFSKGLGAPIGSMLLGTRAAIDRAHKMRKVLGGGMRQAGILAAGALHAVENHVARLADDHANARTFADAVEALANGATDPTGVHTNIVLVKSSAFGMTTDALLARLVKQELRLSPSRAGYVRAVFHLDVSADDTQRAIAAFRQLV